MTFKHVKQHVLKFIKHTYINNTDIYKYITEGDNQPYDKEPVCITMVIYKDEEKKIIDKFLMTMEQKGLDLNYEDKI